MAVGMAPNKAFRRIGAGLCCFVLAGAWLYPEPEAEIQQASLQKVEEVLAQIASGEADAKAQEVAAQDGLVSGGSPCFMRHKRMALGVPQAFRSGFAAATLATDPVLKARLLDELAAQASPGPAAWRIAMAQAELAVRSNQAQEAERFLSLAAQQDVPMTCRADELVLRADLLDPADAAALLDQAIAADPGFWTAQERLALLATMGTGRDITDCDADAARTIRTATQLAALAQLDSQFQRLERGLAGITDNGRGSLLRGMIQRATGRPDAALKTWKAGLEQISSAPCDLAIGRALEGMIASMEGKS